jgi:hypothetical protein
VEAATQAYIDKNYPNAAKRPRKRASDEE